MLLVERDTRIASLTLSADNDAALAVRLDDEHGAPVDLSVVHLDVFDPAGKLVRYYSGNVTIRQGQANFPIPFALNDPKGTWRVQARDVVSGLTAKQAIER